MKGSFSTAPGKLRQNTTREHAEKLIEKNGRIGSLLVSLTIIGYPICVC